ncbi:4160699e-79b7-4a42-aa73-ee63220c7968 [Sclerotinia trifoliorum]|uniref:4160699e-79b7-4a42-aa73-ee63220c7968 n=1 Tax=Sclerotinia trifoliorum TaxID=28548 RepID=A0A8H2VVK9_9HELO|nr:4160699e-79b7-4a42-aa73-ee63220c7968 [Sclerotinia trifoliorum]
MASLFPQNGVNNSDKVTFVYNSEFGNVLLLNKSNRKHVQRCNMTSAFYNAPQPLEKIRSWNPMKYDKVGFEAIHPNSPEYTLDGNHHQNAQLIPTHLIFPYNALMPAREDFLRMTEVVVRFQDHGDMSSVAATTGRWSEAHGVLIFRHDLNISMYRNGINWRYCRNVVPTSIIGLYRWSRKGATELTSNRI